MDGVIGWIFWMVTGIALAALIFCVVMIFKLAIWGDPAEQQFMTACIADRGATKEYECRAMWRAGDRNITPMPMPIIVPVR